MTASNVSQYHRLLEVPFLLLQWYIGSPSSPHQACHFTFPETKYTLILFPLPSPFHMLFLLNSLILEQFQFFTRHLLELSDSDLPTLRFTKVTY